MPYNKLEDSYRYKTAEIFFKEFDDSTSFQRIKNVKLVLDQRDHSALYNGYAFKFADASEPLVERFFIIQFVRPDAFRILFNPQSRSLDDYKDEKSRDSVRELVRPSERPPEDRSKRPIPSPSEPQSGQPSDLVDTFKGLVTLLDRFENIKWKVVCESNDSDDYVVIESRTTERDGSPCTGFDLRIQVFLNNLEIIVVKRIPHRVSRLESILKAKNVLKDPTPVNAEKVIWRTKPGGILYSGTTSLIEVEKPAMARYLGFGEQGGRQLLKTKVILDYFNFDNMTYSQVYGKGPLDSREPLYHSEPFWMEIAQHPDYSLKLANFIDNFSQVCVDIGSKDNSKLRVATRFGFMRFYVIASDSISQLINTYTSIVGRPALKPRYVLGYHQGSYGYTTAQQVRGVVDQYRNNNFPLDGLHIDVDFQREYRTFTINEEQNCFENPTDFFKGLRAQGVKCGTNITPFISAYADASYKTLKEGRDHGYFVKDERYTDDNGPSSAEEDEYMLYPGLADPRDGSKMDLTWKATEIREPKNKYKEWDVEPLGDTWNKNKDFRGGVYYGGIPGRGGPGYYPDLNRRDVRIWWGIQYDYLIESGLEFVWQDMTSPCMGGAYGDMKSFPFRLLLSPDLEKPTTSSPNEPKKSPAIEIWAMYSLNLHKATYNGWNFNPARKGKRNFIIGRGGFIGLHRYAGLWTGDNASTWKFLRVSVSQVLSLGLSGITISGADVGGFEPRRHGQEWLSPELLMRWYCAYSLLPWFRNHYKGHTDIGGKVFQEPYRYSEKFEEFETIKHGHDHEKKKQIPQDAWLYSVTLPIISNPDDGSLVTENSHFLDDEYTVGDDLLVAPILGPQMNNKRKKGAFKPYKATRIVYLPRPDSWWPFNLHANGPDKAVKLENPFAGGSLIPYNERIHEDKIDKTKLDGINDPMLFINPMFIRFGAIIPQLETRSYAEDHKPKSEGGKGPNQITIHLYPGITGFNKIYDMYLDDGISRNSAPTATELQKEYAKIRALNQAREAGNWNPDSIPTSVKISDENKLKAHEFGDEEADNAYMKVRIGQWTETINNDRIRRTVTVETVVNPTYYWPYNQYGDKFKLFIWRHPEDEGDLLAAKFKVSPSTNEQQILGSQKHNPEKNLWELEINIESVRKSKHTIVVEYGKGPSKQEN